MLHHLSLSFDLNSPNETTKLGALLALHLTQPACVLLSGNLGAGKSHLARALIQKKMADAGRVEDVPSPTFTLVQTYEFDDSELWHADLYRLSHPDELIEIGLDEAFETSLCLIEWPERLGDNAPSSALKVKLESVADGASRKATLSGLNTIWETTFEELNKSWVTK